jgi:23S rRNA (cytosine1962-C5)-methyltransferase
LSKVILKEGREKSVLQRHPWIFSGAIYSLPQVSPGTILPVYSACGRFLAQAYFHPTNSIAGRIVSFEDIAIESALERHMRKAIALRKTFIDRSHTNAFRLINAEGDGLPGLVVDCYHDVLVIQITTCGMELLRQTIISLLISLLAPRSIYEKSLSFARKQEGLPDREGVIYGEDLSEVSVLENGMQFLVSLTKGQKTGLFLDQRERRLEIERLAKNRKVLNCFSYTGGFSLFALRGGAELVHSVDSCPDATQAAEDNVALNGFSRHTSFTQDAFTYLKNYTVDYDLIILDPPAFAKKRGDITSACHGYKAINRLVMEKAKPGTLLLSCSCSYYIDTKLFQSLLFQSAHEANREVKILTPHLQAFDHPISLFHPEGDYLKSFLLYI